MSTETKPKDYELSDADKTALGRFLHGATGSRTTGKEMRTNHQNIYRIVTSLTRQAVMRGDIDIKQLMQ